MPSDPMGDLGLVLTPDEIDQILSGKDVPQDVVQAIKAGKTLRRFKRDAIYTTLRWCDAGGAATVGNQPIAAGTYNGFVTPVGQSGQGLTPKMTFAETNLRKSGESPFSLLFIGRRLNFYVWSNSRSAATNQADGAVDAIVHGSYATLKKGTSFEWNIGNISKAVNFRGNKLYSVKTDAVGYGIGDGYNLGVPFLVDRQESLAIDIVVNDPAGYGITLPNTYTVDLRVELDGDAIEIVSQ